MVKGPSASKHGLDRKYKSWRRGKSQKAKVKGSLKSQLRGQQRLLTKAKDEEHSKLIREKIEELKSEIERKQLVEIEKSNAKKSHGTRFLERQRLVRSQRNLEKNNKLKGEQLEQKLTKIAVDMAYVAYHPHDVKYMPLFAKGNRIVDQPRDLAKRATTRQRVLEKLQQQPDDANGRVTWISKEQYNRLPKTWTVDMERKIFGEATSVEKELYPAEEDDRFALAAPHSALLEAAEKIQSQLDQEEAAALEEKTKEKKQKPPEALSTDKKKDHSNEESSSIESSSVSSSSDDDEADPLVRQPLLIKESSKNSHKVREDEVGTAVASTNSSSDDGSSTDDSLSDSSDDDSSSDDDNDESTNVQKKESKSSTSSSGTGSSSEDSSSSSEDESPPKPTEVPEPQATSKSKVGSDDDDDFLVEAVDENNSTQDIFSNAKLAPQNEARGDKSKGWATQRQRPGQFKKRRTRR